jgi:predicted neutral ceramidase superfamily lipid hydrolase
VANGRAGRGRGNMRRPLLPGTGPLAGVSPVLVFLVVVVVFAAGVLLGGFVGALLLAVLTVGVAVLLATTWGRLSPPERVARSLILVVLVLVTVGVALR